MTITIPTLSTSDILRRAVAHYNRRRDPAKPMATFDADERFLARLCVNWLRHEGTHYDGSRNLIHGHDAAIHAGTIIKRRTLAAIATEYPWLSDECQRQVESER